MGEPVGLGRGGLFSNISALKTRGEAAKFEMGVAGPLAKMIGGKGDTAGSASEGMNGGNAWKGLTSGGGGNMIDNAADVMKAANKWNGLSNGAKSTVINDGKGLAKSKSSGLMDKGMDKGVEKLKEKSPFWGKVAEGLRKPLGDKLKDLKDKGIDKIADKISPKDGDNKNKDKPEKPDSSMLVDKGKKTEGESAPKDGDKVPTSSTEDSASKNKDDDKDTDSSSGAGSSEPPEGGGDAGGGGGGPGE